MPNITVKKKLFLREIDEENYSDEDVELLCFNFGIEVDEITSDRKEAEKERGFSEELYKFSDEVTYKIAVPANRNDLLCLEGLARALRVFLNKESPPIYTEIKTETPVQCLVRNSVLSVRPIIVCAILRNLSFTEETLKSFMNLQDKLHQNIGRERTLVSIGTHDFDKIQPPFVYEARPPSAISFVALEQHKSMSPGELFSLYRVGGSKAKKYLHIIEDMACYPLLLDSEGVVLSLPPIINGEHSRVSTETRNVFIECTATDYVRACVVLDTIICMFSQYSQPRFTYESVEVLYPDGARQIYTMSCREETIAVDYINQHIGVTLSASAIATLLSKMCLQAAVHNDQLSVLIPPTRADILHKCDIMEDVAIAYGYNNICKTYPRTCTIGQQLPVNKLTDLLRLECAMAGFTEVLTSSLISHDEYFKYLLKADSGEVTVKVDKPAASVFQIIRPSLVPGILKAVSANKFHAKPIMLFEISDVVVKNETSEIGCSNRRHLCLIHFGTLSGLELIQGMLDRVMAMLKFPQTTVDPRSGYYVSEYEESFLLPGRSARVYVGGEHMGCLGIVHPEVLAYYELTCPCALLELDIQQFESYTSTCVAWSGQSQSGLK